MEKNSKVIVNPRVARNLLKVGCQIIDIKKSKKNADATVFVFHKDAEFDAALDKILASFEKKDTATLLVLNNE